MKIFIERSFKHRDHFTATTKASLLDYFSINAKQGKKDLPNYFGLYNTELTRLDYYNIVKSPLFDRVCSINDLFN